VKFQAVRFRTGISFAIRVGYAGLAYLVVLLLARWMSAVEYGWYAIGISVATIGIQVVGLGQPTAVLRFWPAHMARDEPALAWGALRQATLLTLAGATVGSVLVFLGGLVLNRLASGVRLPVIAAIAGLLFVMTLAEFAASALRAVGSVIAALLPRDILWRIAIIAAGAAYAFLRRPLTSAAALNWSTITLLALVAWQAWELRRRIPPAIRALTPQYNHTDWRIAGFGFWAVAAANALIVWIDPVIVGTFVKSADAGHFFAASRTASLLGLVLISVNIVTSPLVSAHHHRGETASIQALCRSVAPGLLIFTTVGFLVLFVFAGPIMGYFGGNFASLAWVLRILAFGSAINTLFGPTGQVMLMTGSERLYLAVLLVTIAFKIPLEIVALRFAGLPGAAMVSAGAQVAWNLAPWVYLVRKMGIDTSVASLLRRPAPG